MTEGKFKKALSKLRLPGGSQLKFLKWHAQAKGRAANMRLLAKKAGYNGWNGMNLQYGILARKIGEAGGQSNPRINLLVEFVAPKGHSGENISNSEWILVMREPFAKALKAAGWI
jgi:hypothetical protein